MVRRATTKSRLPLDVKLLDPQRLQPPQLRIMLDHLGVGLRSQPKAKGDKANMLRQLIDTRPEDAQKAYDVVVWAKLPEPPKVQDVEQLRSQLLGTMSQLLSDEQMDQLEASVEPIVDKARKSIDQLVAKAVAAAAENHRPIKILSGRKTKKVEGVLPEEFPRLLQLASQRVPVYMVGPSGCGKTHVAGKIAEALDLKFADQSCSEGVSETVFIGWLLPIDGGDFVHVTTPFLECYEKGGVFLFDEIDASDSNFLTFLNKAIANDGFTLPQRHKKPWVKKHKDFVAVAAANTYGAGADAQYVGRNALDAASLDRFRVGTVRMDYSPTVETALVNPDVLEWGRRVRKFIKDNNLRRIMSTRVMLDLTTMVDACAWTMEDWEHSYFSDWSKDEIAKWRNVV